MKSLIFEKLDALNFLMAISNLQINISFNLIWVDLWNKQKKIDYFVTTVKQKKKSYFSPNSFMFCREK